MLLPVIRYFATISPTTDALAMVNLAVSHLNFLRKRLKPLSGSIARAGAARSGDGRLREQTDITEGYRTAEVRLEGLLLQKHFMRALHIEELYKY